MTETRTVSEAAIRQRVAHATLARFEDHTLYDGHDCWRCAMVDREHLLALLDEARAAIPHAPDYGSDD